MSDTLSCFNSLVDSAFDKIENIKRQYGVVKKIISDTDSAKVKVKIRNIVNSDLSKTEIENDPDEKNWLTLLNKTGQRLKVGDTIWVHYWRTITDGYVAIKIGKQSQGGGRIGLDKAMTITDKHNVINNISQTVSSFGVQNKVTKSCGDTPSVIYVGGCPAVYYAGVSALPQIYSSTAESGTWRTRINNFKQFIMNLDDSLFIKDISNIYIGSLNNSNYKKVDIHFGVYTITGGVGSFLWAVDYNINSRNFINYYNTFATGKVYCPTMMYNEVGSDQLNPMTQRDMAESVFDFWGVAPSDQFTQSDILFPNYASALNGGFIYVYDNFYLNSDVSVPYGYLTGKWVYKSFSKGKLLTPDPSIHRAAISADMPYIAGEEYRVCSCDGNSQNKGGYAPIFSSSDEREYVRQTLSRIESAPY